MVTEAVIGAAVEAIASYVLEQSELASHVSRQFGRDPVQRALHTALKKALEDIELLHPDAESNLFDAHFLQHSGAEILAQFLTRHEQPTGSDMSNAWADSLKLVGSSRMAWIQAIIPVATDFLTSFEEAAKKQQSLQEIFDRRNREQVVSNTAQIAAKTDEIVELSREMLNTQRKIAAHWSSDKREDLANEPTSTQHDFPYRHDPCPHHAIVVGRQTEITHISQAMLSSETSVLVLYGFQGMGKTAVAAKVYEEIKSRFAVAIWHSADDPFRLASLYQRLTGELPPKQAVQQGPTALVHHLLEALRSSKVLIVLDGFERLLHYVAEKPHEDNLEFAALVGNLYNVNLGESRILLTGWHRLADQKQLQLPSRRLDKLTIPDSVELLRKLLPSEMNGQLGEGLSVIAGLARGNPQAVHWLANVLRSSDLSSGSTAAAEVLMRELENNMAEELVAEKIFAHYAGYLDRDDKVLLLDLCVFGRAVPFSAVTFMRKSTPSWTERKIRSRLSKLAGKAMINQLGSYYSEDDIVAVYFHDRSKRDASRHRKAAEWYKAQMHVDHPRMWANSADSDPFLQYVFHCCSAGDYDSAFALWEQEMAFHLDRLALHSDRIRMSMMFLDAINKGVWSPKPLKHAWLLRNIGYSYGVQGDHVRAFSSLSSALLILDSCHESAIEISMNRVICLNALAAVHRDRHEYEKAIAYNGLALEAFQKGPYTDPKSLARTLGDIGQTYLARGIELNQRQDFVIAQSHLREALSKSEHYRGDVARILAFLAESLVSLDDLDEATQTGWRALMAARDEGEVFAEVRALRVLSVCTASVDGQLAIALLEKSSRLCEQHFYELGKRICEGYRNRHATMLGDDYAKISDSVSALRDYQLDALIENYSFRMARTINETTISQDRSAEPKSSAS